MGKAYVAGYPGGTQPPTSLVVEVRRPNGKTTRVEVPAEAFGALVELLATWPPVVPRR
jgi:hypothetical protein